MDIDKQELERIITTALKEDIGNGDITSNHTIPPEAQTKFAIVTREPVVVCGIAVVAEVFRQVDPTVQLAFHQKDGDKVNAGGVLVSGEGNARSVLAAERIALNFMQRMTGIATQTGQYVQAVAGTKAKVLDTRKTTPGLRALEKYAVKMGGGHNHRFRLDDGILIKDNHISVAGSISKAVSLTKAGVSADIKVEVECDTLVQVGEALASGADIIMLDNMTLEDMRKAVALVAGRVPLEASGNVRLENIKEIAATGVDYISVGRLTHSVKSADIGLDIIS